MGFVEVANVNDLDDGQMVGFEADGRRILLAKVDGEFFAIGATCTHERSNLDQGSLIGHVVYCPLHYSAFDVCSGEVLGPPAECAVPAHEVRVEDGKVLVSTQPLDSGAGPLDTAGAPLPDAGAPLPDTGAPLPDTEAPTLDTGVPALDTSTRARVELLIGQMQSNLNELRTIVVRGAPPLDPAVSPPEAARVSKAAPEPVAGAWSLQPPRFMGRITTSARYLPVAIAIPTVLVALLVLTASVLFRDGPAVPDGDILFEHFIGHGWLDVFTLPLVGVVGLLAATGLRRFWKGLHATLPPGIPLQPLGGALRETAEEVVTHEDFGDWTTSDVRRTSHLAMFYGFLGLVAATTGAALYTEIFPILGIEWHRNELSLPIWDPVKIIGNVGGIALLIGLAQTLSMWRRRPRTAGASTYSEWFFPVSLVLTAVTGFLTEILRFAGVRMAYAAYAVHLVFVFALFVFFPFSKFAHAIYHPAARTFGRQVRRRNPAPTFAPAPSPLDSDAAPV